MSDRATMRPRRRDDDEHEETIAELLGARLGAMVQVRTPGEEDPPILAPAVRAAVLQWLAELNSAKELAAVGVTPRRTGLYSGPPGTGKTTLAYHLAGRLGLPLVIANLHMVASKWVNDTGENVGKLFDTLRRHSDRCVLLLDEFDAIGRARSDDGGSVGRESNKVVVALLQEIDRYSGILIAATNNGDSIDPALWRRFGINLEIGLPGDDQRFAIMKRYLAPMDLPEAALDTLCAAAEGATPALLRQLMEGIKRDLILAPKFSQPTGARACFGRILATVAPHADLPRPPLWDDGGLDLVADLPWPPTRSA